MYDTADLVQVKVCKILDSGFCVLKAIIKLQRKGVYASAVVNRCEKEMVMVEIC